jgi:predicted DCC family thiol-disulfide oxidoreductase YuxK
MGLPYRTAVVVAALSAACFYIPDSLLPPQGAESWLFFDGHCNLCDGFVNFVVSGDSARQIKFGAQQKHQELMKKYNAPVDLSTVVLIQGGQVYTRSTAVMRVFARIDSPHRYLSIFYLIPSPIRDVCYGLVAKYRYVIFGHSEKCREPTKEFESRFLEYVAPTKPDFVA